MLQNKLNQQFDVIKNDALILYFYQRGTNDGDIA